VITLQCVARVLLAKQKLARRKLEYSIERKRQLCEDLTFHHSEKHYQKASRAAEGEVELLLAGDRATIEFAGFCLNRLVSHVTHFRYLVQAEANEAKEAIDTFQSVIDECASY
jgi:hypothetical protein